MPSCMVAERADPAVSDHNMTSPCCVRLTLLKLAMCDDCRWGEQENGEMSVDMSAYVYSLLPVT